MSTTITLIPGDGIGPATIAATVDLLSAAGARLDYDRQLAGMAAVHEVANPLPPETIESIEQTGILLKGPLTTPVGSGFRSINVALRKEFDLYANVRPTVTLMPGGRYEDIDLVMIRENTEGLYVGVEHYIGIHGDPKAAAESVMIVTRFGAERIVRYAFDYAVAHNRKLVTFAHKANIPWRFDVLVMENMFGDIVSDLMAGLVGGLGMAPGGNIGEKTAMFEPVHGSAPDIAGQNIANPTAQFLAACMLLDHIGQGDVASRIREAIATCLRAGDTLTRDLGGTASTQEFARAVIGKLP
jgi:isocitrate dehydrogenase (NAD+)